MFLPRRSKNSFLRGEAPSTQFEGQCQERDFCRHVASSSASPSRRPNDRLSEREMSGGADPSLVVPYHTSEQQQPRARPAALYGVSDVFDSSSQFVTPQQIQQTFVFRMSPRTRFSFVPSRFHSSARPSPGPKREGSASGIFWRVCRRPDF